MAPNQKIEYKLFHPDTIVKEGWFTMKVDSENIERALNRLGEEGWDVVTTLGVQGELQPALLLKRYV